MSRPLGKTKKEEIGRCEKRLAALFERVPSRDRRKLQKEIDECNAFILRHHQLLQSAKDIFGISHARDACEAQTS